MVYMDREEITVRNRDRETGQIREVKTHRRFSFRVRAHQNSFYNQKPLEMKFHDEDFVRAQAPTYFKTAKEFYSERRKEAKQKEKVSAE